MLDVHTSTRVQSTLDTHAPRVRASPAMHMLYAATRAHVKKLGCRARVTGHWLTVGRPAAGTSGSHTRCKHARHLRCVRSPCIADMLCMPSTSTVARCHRTAERHDDNDRDEDERHDAEDREHDERSQRVRARSRLPLSRAKAHAHARCQAPLSKTRTLPTPRPSAGSPLAHLARMRSANTLAISAAREAHASSTHCACHPPPTLHRTQRHDDNDRDEDERHDEEDR